MPKSCLFKWKKFFDIVLDPIVDEPFKELEMVSLLIKSSMLLITICKKLEFTQIVFQSVLVVAVVVCFISIQKNK